MFIFTLKYIWEKMDLVILSFPFLYKLGGTKCSSILVSISIKQNKNYKIIMLTAKYLCEYKTLMLTCCYYYYHL